MQICSFVGTYAWCMHMCVKTDQCTFLASEFVPLIEPGDQSSSLPIVSGKSLTSLLTTHLC